MVRRLIVFGLLSVLAVAGVIIGVTHRPERGPETRITSGAAARSGRGAGDPVAQQAAERIHRDVRFRYVASIGNSEEAPLMMPIHVRIDSSGCVYVLDWSDRCVKKYDQAGVYLARFGYGEGRAPGEFSNLSDFDIAPDGAVWACDPVNGVVTVFEEDGSVRTTVRPDRPPHRIALLRSGECAVMSSPVGARMFRVYGPGAQLIAEYGELMEQQARLGIALDGRIAAIASGGFAYAAYRAGVLAVTTATGDSISAFRRTVEHGGFPDVLVSRSGDAEFARTDPDAPIITRSISCVDHEIHLLVGSDGRPHTGVMDVYDARDGSYRYSYDLPVDAVAVCASRGWLAAVSDTTVTIWEPLPAAHGR